VSQELRTALLKLSAALPDTRRGDEKRTRQRIHLDSTWWFQPEEPVPHLQTIYQAVWEDRKLHLTIRLNSGRFSIRRSSGWSPLWPGCQGQRLVSGVRDQRPGCAPTAFRT